jgi:pyrroloquinoline quinone biosynthesis protein A
VVARWQGRVWLRRMVPATLERRSNATTIILRSFAMWTKPEFTEMRFGFEVTMYIYNR